MFASNEADATRLRGDLERLSGAYPGKLGVAVSGGPDSLALLILAASAFPEWVEAATVDHGLRRDSRGEAGFVADICARLDVPHEILEVEVAAADEGLQAAARDARYAALEAWAVRRDIPFILTAHHADDQAETLLMRLQRGAGLAGLAGVRPKRALGNATILRPLLGWRRSELAMIVEQAGIEPVQDPSNRDPRFDRVRMRGRLTEAPWLDAQALARSAGALAESEDALAWMTERLWRERAERTPKAVLLDACGLPPELIRRLLLRALHESAPDARLRGEKVQRLMQALGEGRTATLAGVKCSGGQHWRFEPAPPRSSRG
jgi:tRNA(Ile)-lysidine synthase